MKKIFIGFLILFINDISAQAWKTEDQYIQRFAPYAVEQMEKYQIPASITLAQALLETGGGQSRLAQQGNNHFGIKCKEDWYGKTMYHTDDAPNECFRVYDDPKDSYEDHSKFLKFRKFYQGLFLLDSKDYRAWAVGLKKAGYATNPRYANILIDKIERYRLYEFDNINPKEVLNTIVQLYPELKNDKIFLAKWEQNKVIPEPKTLLVPYQQTSFEAQQKRVEKIKDEKELLNSILVKSHPNGERKFIIIPVDTDIDFIAKKFAIKADKLMKWNELSQTILPKNAIVFLESKSNRANVETYTVQSGEKMYDIAQKFGIKLSKLYSRNRMEEGQEPKVGEILYLNSKKPR